MANLLAGETSPYLLQHAANPVDWRPWNDAALSLARREDRPILLSIGYSACHWCHVMAHESFEDPEVAALMNRLFVNVKVDREERPDLDQIYQTAHQMLAGRPGGWPLTVFLAPDGTPFFAGTYFPKQSRYGLPGFPEVLERIASAWNKQRAAIGEQNESLRAALAGTLPGRPAAAGDLSGRPLASALQLLESNYDAINGGFGDTPKFPHPTDLDFLLRRHWAAGDAQAARMALTTLTRMAEGGLYDQLGGGFCRYSVDARWEIPHFEKMLYDNGLLLGLYADAWVITGEPLFARVVEETVAWLGREMQAPAGAYYAALDADAAGEEGTFYVWTAAAARDLLDADEWAVVGPHYGFDGPPNFEGHAWHLRVATPLDAVAARLGLEIDECRRRLDGARAKLFAARELRPRPGCDDKILTAWNGLAIAGVARAARVFRHADWLEAARRALDYVRRTLWQPATGRLLATGKGDAGRLDAYLDDHAFLLAALIELMQTDFRSDDLAFATDLADALLARFEDPDDGGFFFTAHDHEALIHRPKSGHDNALPSGNGVAARALQRLTALTGEPRYAEAAARALAQFWPDLAARPGAGAALLAALEEYLVPPTLVVLRGPADGVESWQRVLSGCHLPRTMVVSLAIGVGPLPPALAKPEGDRVNAWVCEGVKCLAPVIELEALLEMVSKPLKVH